MLLPAPDLGEHELDTLRKLHHRQCKIYIIGLRTNSNTLVYSLVKYYTRISIQTCNSPQHHRLSTLRHWQLVAVAPISPCLSKGREAQRRHQGPRTRGAHGCSLPQHRSPLLKGRFQWHSLHLLALLLLPGCRRMTGLARHAARSCEDRPLHHSRPGVRLQRPRTLDVCRPAQSGYRPRGSPADEHVWPG
jgi:hypothetical protein